MGDVTIPREMKYIAYSIWRLRQWIGSSRFGTLLRLARSRSKRSKPHLTWLKRVPPAFAIFCFHFNGLWRVGISGPPDSVKGSRKAVHRQSQ